MATKVILTNNNEVNIPTFRSLAMGEWFIFDEELYCKIAPDDRENNAFHPRSSHLVDFDGDENIIPVAEVEICF